MNEGACESLATHRTTDPPANLVTRPAELEPNTKAGVGNRLEPTRASLDFCNAIWRPVFARFKLRLESSGDATQAGSNDLDARGSIRCLDIVGEQRLLVVPENVREPVDNERAASLVGTLPLELLRHQRTAAAIRVNHSRRVVEATRTVPNGEENDTHRNGVIGISLHMDDSSMSIGVNGTQRG